MSGHFIGPVPPQYFLDAFLPRVDGKSAPRPNFAKVTTGPGKEKGMYEPLMRAIHASDCCPSFFVADTSGTKDALTGSKPDCSIIHTTYFTLSTVKRNHMSLVDIPIEMKPMSSQDAFVQHINDREAIDEEIKISIQKTTETSILHRGQQIDYITSIMALQHRAHVFSISVSGNSARLIRWDRAGAVVSSEFDYVDAKAENYLGEFLFRYENATLEQRGHDTTIKLAAPGDHETYKTKIEDYLKWSSVERKAQVKEMQQGTHPTYSICVSDGPPVDVGPPQNTVRETRSYLVGAPFIEALSPCGRATRGFLIWSLGEETMLFLKDTWRADEGRKSEAEIYKLLREAQVPERHLPRVLICGDVYSNDGQRQETKTHEYATDNHKWHRPTNWIRKHIRHRVVQALGFPLEMVPSSRQLTQAMRDTLNVIHIAFHEAHILHRDISVGNIMLDEKFVAFLNDWDHAVVTTEEQTSHPYRTGTWPFMSVGLQVDPAKAHTIMDDVESCFWVFYYTALHHFKIISGKPRVDIFDEQKQQEQAGRVVSVGGYGKLAALTSEAILDIQFESRPMTDAIHGFAGILGEYHRALVALRGVWRRKADDTRAREELKTVSEKIEGVLDIIAIFDESLASTEWPEGDDAIPDPFPLETAIEDHNKFDKVHINSFASFNQPHPDPAVNHDKSGGEAGPSNIATQIAFAKGAMGPPPVPSGRTSRPQNARRSGALQKRASSTGVLGRRRRNDSEASSRNLPTKKGRKERTGAVSVVGEPDMTKGPVTRSQAGRQQRE